MAFFDENVRKTKEIAAELERQCAELEGAFSALGKAYYSKHAADPEDGFGEYLAAINAAEKRVSVYRELSARARGVAVCSGCGSEVALGTAFCSVCGNRMEAPKPLTDGVNIYCEVCMAPMPIGQKFCTSCGATLPSLDGDVPVDAAPVGRVCPVCGAPLADGQKFCTVCGAKADDVNEEPAAEAAVETPAAEEIVEAAAETPAVEEIVEAVEETPAAEEIAEEVAEEIPAAAEIADAVEEAPAAEEVKEVAAEIKEEAEASFETPTANNAVVCPKCGKQLPVGIKFCTGCGTPLAGAAAPDERVCPNCGKTLSPTSKFCTGCGTKL